MLHAYMVGITHISLKQRHTRDDRQKQQKIILLIVYSRIYKKTHRLFSNCIILQSVARFRPCVLEKHSKHINCFFLCDKLLKKHKK